MAEPEQFQQDAGHLRLKNFLTQHRIDAEIIVAGADTPTVPAAAEALGVRPDQIVKSLIFHGRCGQSVVTIVRGTAKVDRGKLSRLAGLRKPRLAPPELVQEITGFKAGGTPPIGHRARLTVYMDDGVFEEPVVFGGGGEIDAVLRISPETIRNITDAVVADICEQD